MDQRSGIERMRAGLMALAALFLAAASAVAHEIPSDVKINAFLRPAGERLELLIRVPLAAMIEVEYPTRGPGYLDVSRADEALASAVKIYLTDNITVYEDDVALTPRLVGARVSLASDRSFVSYERARAHMDAPRLPDDFDLYWGQLLLDVLLDYPIRSERSAFSIRPRVDRFGGRVTTALRFLPPGGAVRAFELHGDPGLVRLDPGLFHALTRFVSEGFFHILSGADHLLFLVLLVIPFRRLRSLAVIVTAFTLGHSISLAAAAFGFVPDGLWFPPLVETLIAVTIVLMGLENIVIAATGRAAALGRRWMVAFAFGVVHGFGFSFALADTLQFAGDHLVTALFAFNLGVEIGQLAVLVVLVPALALLFRLAMPERVGVIVLSALVLHTGWHWMLDRGGELLRFPLPTIDAAFLAGAMRGLIAVLVLAGLVMLANGLVRRFMAGADEVDVLPVPVPDERH